jgi:heme oxygenase
MPLALAARLRQETAALHRQAERAGVMRDILAGRVDRPSYTALLRALVPVYRALERGLAAHPALSPLPLPALERSAALADDLAVLHGPAWEAELPPVPAGEAYGARISAGAAACPPLLTAHAYVRYLGDLSGGQALGRLIAGQLGLEGEAGVTFYRFAALEPIGASKQAFRAGLDALALSPADADAVVREAREAFVHNIRVFEAITPAPSPRPPPSGG